MRVYKYVYALYPATRVARAPFSGKHIRVSMLCRFRGKTGVTRKVVVTDLSVQVWCCAMRVACGVWRVSTLTARSWMLSTPRLMQGDL